MRTSILDPGALRAQDDLRDALRQVIDPEVGINIVDLGLVHRVEAHERGVIVEIGMTSPACPLGDLIIEDAKTVLTHVLPAGTPLQVRLVDTPVWEASMMSAAARRALGW